MTNTISNGTTTITPLQVLGWESKQATRHVLHEILNKASHDVTMRPSSLRYGSLKLLFATAALAESARAIHTQSSVFTLSSDEVTQVAMSYIVSGDVTVSLDSKSLTYWMVSIDYQEVVT
jgi:hypothetical protein